MMVAASCCGGEPQQQGHGDWSELREGWTQPNTEPLQGFLGLGQWFSFKHNNFLKHIDKKMLEWLHAKYVSVLDQLKSRFKPHKTSMERAEDSQQLTDTSDDI